MGRTLATTPTSRDEGSKQPAAARNSQEVVGAWEPGRGEVVWEEGDKRLRGEEGYSTAIQRCSTHWQPTTHSISIDSGQEGRAAAAGSSSLSVTAAITQSVTLLPRVGVTTYQYSHFMLGE